MIEHRKEVDAKGAVLSIALMALSMGLCRWEAVAQVKTGAATPVVIAPGTLGAGLQSQGAIALAGSGPSPAMPLGRLPRLAAPLSPIAASAARAPAQLRLAAPLVGAGRAAVVRGEDGEGFGSRLERLERDTIIRLGRLRRSETESQEAHGIVEEIAAGLQGWRAAGTGAAEPVAADASRPGETMQARLSPGGPPLSEGVVLELGPGHDRASALKFSADKTMVAGVNGQTTVAWDTRTGKKLFERPWHELVALRDGLWYENVNVYKGPHTFTLFDPVTRTEKLSVPGLFTREIDRRRLLISGPEGHGILDIDSGRVTPIEGQPTDVSSDGELLLTIAAPSPRTYDGPVRLPADPGLRDARLVVDARSGRTLRAVRGSFAQITADFSRMLVHRKDGWSGSRVLLDPRSGREIKRWRGGWQGMGPFSPGGRWLAFSPSSGWRSLKIVDAGTGETVLEARGHHAVAFDPTDNFLVTLDWRGQSHLWSMASRKEVGPISGDAPVFMGEGASGRVATLAREGDALEVRFWSTATGRLKDVLKLGAVPYADSTRVLFSDGGRRLLVVPPNMWAPHVLWDVAAKRKLGEVYSEEPLALAPDWSVAASAHVGRAAVHSLQLDSGAGSRP